VDAVAAIGMLFEAAPPGAGAVMVADRPDVDP
jgi:hypothetical protein